MSTHAGTLLSDLTAAVDKRLAEYKEFEQARERLLMTPAQDHRVLYFLIGCFRCDADFRQAFIERVKEVCK